METQQSNIRPEELLVIVGTMKHAYPNARIIRPNYTIDHEAKEIVLDPDYDALRNIALPELKTSFLIACAAVAAFVIWMVDFA